MGKIFGLSLLVVVGMAFTGCATGDPRLQGTWKSNKVAMPMEMVKVTKMETVRLRKGSRRTKQVPRTVTVARPKAAPEYIDLVLRYRGARVTFEMPAEDGGKPSRISVPYHVVSSTADSVVIELPATATGKKERINIKFDGENRYWVNPAGGNGWREYYQRLSKQA